MGSAWNMIGLSVWVLIVIWIGWMIIALRRRRRQATLIQNYHPSRRQRIITLIQSLGLVVTVMVMGILTFWDNQRLGNVRVVSSYKPVVLDTNGYHSYYVNAYQGNRLTDNYYTYLTKGERYRVNQAHSMILYSRVAGNVQMDFKPSGQQVDWLDRHYQKAWVATISSYYRNNFLNGLAMRAERQAKRYVLIRVPDHSFIYYH